MKRARLTPADELRPMEGVIPPWPGERVELDGSVTFVRRTPATSADAEPALYVHGLGGSALNWTDLAFLLADRLDGEAIDLPGFGYSDPARSYSVTAMAQRVIRWIEHSGRGPVHLFGNSMGGAVAVRVAGTRPDLVRTLTLISPAMPFMDPRRSVQAQLLPLLLVPKVERLAARLVLKLPPEVLASQVIEACFAQPSRLAPQRIAEATEEVRRRYETPWFIDAYLRSLRGLFGAFLRSYLPGPESMWRIAERITAPTLVVTGRQDRLVDIRTAPMVGRLIPDSRLLVLDGVGHVAQMEVPDLVARGVLAMLDEVRAARGLDEVRAARGTVPAQAIPVSPARPGPALVQQTEPPAAVA